MKTNGLKITWFYGFFFVSGFCSLVYEVVWLRLAMAKFGITTPMVSIVLSVFMAGLGIGSWAGGLFIRRFDRSVAVRPLRLYALVELMIGVSGILAPLTIDAGASVLSSAGKTWCGTRPLTILFRAHGFSSPFFPGAPAWAPRSHSPWPPFAGFLPGNPAILSAISIGERVRSGAWHARSRVLFD